MDIVHQLTRIFCEMDDFCKELDAHMAHRLLTNRAHREARGPSCQISISEIMTLLMLFQLMQWRNFKTFYCCFAQQFLTDAFPRLPSYPRFVELMKRAMMPLTLFAQFKRGHATGIYYIDSCCLPVCHDKRATRHRTFQDLAEFGMTSMGWFFGFKLHLVVNDQGQLMAFQITRGNRHDRVPASDLLQGLQGLAFGDKGYISKQLFQELFDKGLKLITRRRKNMKAALLSEREKQLLNQRTLVETVIDHLKNQYQIWHTRHRSATNAMTHLVAGLAVYTIEPIKLKKQQKLTKPRHQN